MQLALVRLSWHSSCDSSEASLTVRKHALGKNCVAKTEGRLHAVLCLFQALTHALTDACVAVHVHHGWPVAVPLPWYNASGVSLSRTEGTPRATALPHILLRKASRPAS